MAQITHGVRAVLSHPLIYSSFQSLMGAHRNRQNFAANYVKPFSGMKVLDLGCGPAHILAYLPEVDYWGFDISEAYIAQAKAKFGPRGRFNCKQLEQEDLAALPKFDVVLAMGLMHHLDDSVAVGVLHLAHEALQAGGRLLTTDPCLDPSQSFLAGILVRNDRGQNVRDKEGYRALVERVFSSPRVEVHHQVWIPYTYCFMECRK
ncbi:class I SAM-dependent methyltransferase [Accumulibacter sp.]|uniref:class I SAM-dependent methyltransferase n=1 Tax=Accumulibacter sp. TaxID=2053492 RepID=UPI00261A7325|nr:class I SAM-dependent methyltransferase [Accumulibacter sp.]